MQPQPPIPEPTSLVSDWHRQKVAAVVAVHLGLTLSVSALWRLLGRNPFEVDSEFLNFFFPILVGVFFGFQVGQTVLLACWVGLASQPWFLRLPRFLGLIIWVQLWEVLGEYLCDGAVAGRLVEEFSASKFLILLTPAIVLICLGFVYRGRFIPTASQAPPNAWQFGTRRLLLLTAEISVLLAVAKITLPGGFDIEDFWRALTNQRMEELLPVLAGITILPVVLFALSSYRTLLTHLALGFYLLIAGATLSWLELASSDSLSSTNWPSPMEAVVRFQFVIAHFSAAATILLTFWVLRRIGYDFRRRDELPRTGDRSSSNANSSAASAAA